MKGVMIQGTSSDSGKSFIVTALCRIFSDMGYKVCPFKSQNMSNNSYVTEDGCEMGRAQGVQAEAARLEPQTFMNPILLKPRRDNSSEIVLMGKVYDAPCDKNYFKNFTMTKGLETLRTSLRHIADNFELIVAEGAGSPAEVNLNDGEIANMRVAREADIPVVLVTDVDRGGSMASIVGTLELLGEDRKRVKGIIFNKFRGDISLFEDAVEWTEKYTGVKVLGVMPMLHDVVIEAEDSMTFNWSSSRSAENCINIGVIKFPRVSNHTDIEAFRYEEDVRVAEISPYEPLDTFDAVILPGTKSTVLDMKFLHDSGLAEKIIDFRSHGGFVFGLCGGYQMMGKKICDSEFKDNDQIAEINGLGLLPVVTTFNDVKLTQKRSGHEIHPSLASGAEVKGYEIHFGETLFCKEKGDFSPLFELDGEPDGAADASLKSAGTYLHNAFHNDIFRNEWLNKIRAAKGLPLRVPVDTVLEKEKTYDQLAAEAKKHLDIEYLLKNIIGA
jgi:adenosylcobyric acid synthase